MEVYLTSRIWFQQLAFVGNGEFAMLYRQGLREHEKWSRGCSLTEGSRRRAVPHPASVLPLSQLSTLGSPHRPTPGYQVTEQRRKFLFSDYIVLSHMLALRKGGPKEEVVGQQDSRTAAALHGTFSGPGMVLRTC